MSTRLAGIALAAFALSTCAPPKPNSSAEAGRPARMYPDYAGTTVPPNIAPLNFAIREDGRAFHVRISGAAGEPVEVSCRNGIVQLAADAWRELLKANAGGEIRTDVWAEGAAGWTHFETARNPVAREEIDPYVVYRYMPPVYDKWARLSIRERDLRSFDERVVFDNDAAGSVCINCHTFLNRRTERMLLHARPSRAGQIPAMILARGGRAEKVDTRMGGRGAASYPAWHPNGRMIAFSRNALVQIFHTAGEAVRDVIDRDSDLGLYDVDSGKVSTVPQISRPDRLESWPAWSPDGRYLYFSSARQLSTDRRNPPPDWETIRYDLHRVRFDPETGAWGEPEVVVAAAALGRSISEPAVSPDGRFVLFTGHDHGSFPIFQPGADLYLLDLAAGAPPRQLDEINSDRADSYHSWSGNSRWIVFSSKREDGVFTRLYLAHMDAAGRFGKPLLLPQRDPEFYGRCAMVFNRPELIAEPVQVSPAELARAIDSGASSREDAKSAEEPYRPAR